MFACVYTGRSVRVGEVDPGPHSGLVLLRLLRLADPGWPAGGAVRRQVDHRRVPRRVDRRHTADAGRVACQLRPAHRAPRHLRHRISTSHSHHVARLVGSTHTHTRTRTRLTALCPRLPGSAGTRKVLDFTEARDSEWQWHQLGHMQVCTSLQTDNHASTSPFKKHTH